MKTISATFALKKLGVGITVLMAVQSFNLFGQVRPPGVFSDTYGSVPMPYAPMGRPAFPQTPDVGLPVGPPGVFLPTEQVHLVRDYSWHYIASPQPR